MSVTLLTPPPFPEHGMGVTSRTSAQPLGITKQKSPSDAGRVLQSPRQSFVVGLRGAWSPAGDKVSVRATTVSGGLGCFSPLAANKRAVRGTSSPAGSGAVTSLAGRLLSRRGEDGSKPRRQLRHALLFSALGLHRDF